MTEEQRDVAASNEKSAKASNEPTESTKARRSGDPSKRAAASAPTKRAKDKPKTQRIGNPQWFVPVMLGLHWAVGAGAMDALAGYCGLWAAYILYFQGIRAVIFGRRAASDVWMKAGVE